MLFRSAHKRYVKHDLQGRVNEFVKALSKDAPFLASNRIHVEWADGDITKKSFLENGQVILRLRRDDPQEANFVNGSYLFISTSLLFKTKRYISPSQREAVDLYVATKLFEREKASVVAQFLEQYLHPKLADPNSKTAKYFDQFAKIDGGGYFYPVLLQELDYLGDKAFGKRQDDRIIAEVNSLISFLEPIAARKVGTETDLDFVQQYCRFAIVIVGKPSKVTPSGDVYVDFIQKQLVPRKIETLYILGLLPNRSTIENICTALESIYETCRTRQSRVLLRYGDECVERQQYLAVLRIRGSSIFQPSDS
jgi:hypothetical protein